MEDVPSKKTRSDIESQLEKILVSVIVPVHNAEKFLDEAFDSVLNQTWTDSLEVSIYNDGCTDDSEAIYMKWKGIFEENGIQVVIGKNESESPGGVGWAKNRAIEQSHGQYLCFLDADDVMLPMRIKLQLDTAKTNDNLIVGSMYKRIPVGSTERYTAWSNSLTQEQLLTQVYTAFGPTIINPTWFCSRKVYNSLGGFEEVKKGFPEDLDFFYRHLDNGGKVQRVDSHLLLYRYHPAAASFGVHENTIWELRMKRLQHVVLKKWKSFTIWNAGKQGRKFYRSLSADNRSKVVAMCDVDEKKIEKSFYTCEMIKDECGKPPRIPIIHYTKAEPPFVICIKLNLTGGGFEKNLASLNLTEGEDYVHFS